MTPLFLRQKETAALQRLHRVKCRPTPEVRALGPELIALFDQTVARRQTKLTKLVEIWLSIVPETLSDHCALLSFVRGTLTVVVDSGSHLYELKQLLLAGLEQQLLLAGRGNGLRKLNLRAGRLPDHELSTDSAPGRKRSSVKTTPSDNSAGFRNSTRRSWSKIR